MTSTIRTQVLTIAESHSMMYVHETYLMRYTRDIVRETIAELELNGYDDAAAQLRLMWKDLLDAPHN